jgi:hypothetical protein
MTPYVIDNMVIAQLAQMRDVFARWEWPPDILKVPRYVSGSEAIGDPKREQCLEQPWIEIVDVPADGDIARFIAEELMVDGRTTADTGEVHCIGVAHHLELPFATSDKNGFILGAAVLGGGRVVLPYDLWLDLEDAGFIDPQERQRLSELTWRNHRQLILKQPKRTRSR